MNKTGGTAKALL